MAKRSSKDFEDNKKIVNEYGNIWVLVIFRKKKEDSLELGEVKGIQHKKMQKVSKHKRKKRRKSRRKSKVSASSSRSESD